MRTLSGEETGSKFRHADRTFESYLEREIQENILHRGFKKNQSFVSESSHWHQYNSMIWRKLKVEDDVLQELRQRQD